MYMPRMHMQLRQLDVPYRLENTPKAIDSRCRHPIYRGNSRETASFSRSTRRPRSTRAGRQDVPGQIRAFRSGCARQRSCPRIESHVPGDQLQRFCDRSPGRARNDGDRRHVSQVRRNHERVHSQLEIAKRRRLLHGVDQPEHGAAIPGVLPAEVSGRLGVLGFSPEARSSRCRASSDPACVRPESSPLRERCKCLRTKASRK